MISINSLKIHQIVGSFSFNFIVTFRKQTEKKITKKIVDFDLLYTKIDQYYYEDGTERDDPILTKYFRNAIESVCKRYFGEFDPANYDFESSDMLQFIEKVKFQCMDHIENVVPCLKNWLLPFMSHSRHRC